MNFFKNNRFAMILTVALVVGLFITLALDFAALHDIHNEYVSKKILKTLDVQLSKEIPDWTANKGEWDYLNLSLLFKALGYAALLTMVICFYKKTKDQT